MFYNLELSKHYVYLIIWPRQCIFKWQLHKALSANQTSILISLGRLNAPKFVILTDARVTTITIISTFTQYCEILFQRSFYDFLYTEHCIVFKASVYSRWSNGIYYLI